MIITDEKVHPSGPPLAGAGTGGARDSLEKLWLPWAPSHGLTQHTYPPQPPRLVSVPTSPPPPGYPVPSV